MATTTPRIHNPLDLIIIGRPLYPSSPFYCILQPNYPLRCAHYMAKLQNQQFELIRVNKQCLV